jgi:hypothetical protein
VPTSQFVYVCKQSLKCLTISQASAPDSDAEDDYVPALKDRLAAFNIHDSSSDNSGNAQVHLSICYHSEISLFPLQKLMV